MPRSQRERLWIVGGGVFALLVIVVGYSLVIGPQRSETSGVKGQVSRARLENAVLHSRIDALRQQNRNLASYQNSLRQSHLALPSTSGLPDFLRSLQSIGNATLAEVSSLTVGTPTDVTAVAGAKSAGVSGVYALPITAQVDGSVSALDAFLTQLQSVQPRAVLISQITESSGADSGGASPAHLNLQIAMQAFVAPVGAAESAQLSAAAHG